MTNISAKLVHAAYLTAIGVGGAMMARGCAYGVLWTWNRCCGRKNFLTQQERIMHACQMAGGLCLAFLAWREPQICDATYSQQILHLKSEVRRLEKELDTLFKKVYQEGAKALREYKGPWQS